MTIMLDNLDRKQQSVIFIIAVLFLFSAGYKVSDWSNKNGDSESGKLEVSRNSDNIQITVHISGAVEKPGVYSMKMGSRVQDGVNRAVSLADADLQGLNLAAALKDGQKLVVPAKQAKAQNSLKQNGAGNFVDNGTASAEVKGVVNSGSADSRSQGLLNINRANSKELEELPGLGPALVERIIIYRETQGFFTSEEEIKNVPGIGDKIYEKIKLYITVN